MDVISIVLTEIVQYTAFYSVKRHQFKQEQLKLLTIVKDFA